MASAVTTSACAVKGVVAAATERVGRRRVDDQRRAGVDAAWLRGHRSPSGVAGGADQRKSSARAGRRAADPSPERTRSGPGASTVRCR